MIGAVLVVGPAGGAPECPSDQFGDRVESGESFAGYPLACLEILGSSLVVRMVERLRQAEVHPIAQVGLEGFSGMLQAQDTPAETRLTAHPPDLWNLALTTMSEYFQRGIDQVVLARLGAHIEFDLKDLLRFHDECARGVCRAYDDDGPLDLWVVGKDQAKVLESSGPPEWAGLPVCPYRRCTYVNRLRNIRELRALVIDCLYSRCSLRPNGTEVRPGVWFDDQAHVDREARVVAPAYIGRRAKVQAAALITRSSSLERDCEVGEATVVEEASILADTYLGRWLDVSNAVVDGNRFVDLRNEVSVEIADSALIGRAGSSSPRIRQADGEHFKFVKRLSGRMKKAFLH